MGIISEAKAAGRDLTAAERSTLEAKNAEIENLTGLIHQAERDAELMKGFDTAMAGHHGTEGLTALSFKGVAARLLGEDQGGPVNIKSLLAAGSQTTETQDVGLTVLKERPPTSFMESIPQRPVAENFSYLRQTVRTNNAAPVAVGALKPTSIFTLTRIESKLRVVAHLSEPIPEYWLADLNSLRQFVEGEMVTGLAEAVAAQALTGDGVGENLTGIITTSGIQSIAFTTDALITIRKSITALENLGLEARLIVMHPSTWESIELLRENGATGGYLLGTTNQPLPIDRARRQIWGVPVALSTSLTAGAGAKALVLGSDSVTLFHDGTVSVKWGVMNDDFGKNQVRCRAEGRFQMGVTRPSGVVYATVAA